MSLRRSLKGLGRLTKKNAKAESEGQAPTETLDEFLLPGAQTNPEHSRHVHRVLVLGLNTSARSRFMASLMYQSADGIPDSTLEEWWPAIIEKTIECCHAFARLLSKLDPPLSAQIEGLLPGLANDSSRPETARQIYEIWIKTWTQEGVCSSSNDVPMPPFFDYFLGHIQRILSPTYYPTFHDTALVDFPTHACWHSAMVLHANRTLFRLYELDHRILRRAEMTPARVSSIHRIFYFVNLANYDHIRASMSYFERLWDLPIQHAPALIIFTGYQDFQSNIIKTPLQTAFPDYNEQAYRSAFDFILTKFKKDLPPSQITTITISGELFEPEFTVFMSFLRRFVFSVTFP